MQQSCNKPTIRQLNYWTKHWNHTMMRFQFDWCCCYIVLEFRFVNNAIVYCMLSAFSISDEYNVFDCINTIVIAFVLQYIVEVVQSSWFAHATMVTVRLQRICKEQSSFMIHTNKSDDNNDTIWMQPSTSHVCHSATISIVQTNISTLFFVINTTTIEIQYYWSYDAKTIESVSYTHLTLPTIA